MTIKTSGFGIISGAALAIGMTGAVFAQDSELVGSWTCSGSAEDAEMGVTMNASYEQNFASDGTYERNGRIQLAIQAMQVNLTLVIDESGKWRRDGMSIGETPTAIEIETDKDMPNQIEQMMLAQMTAEAEQELNNETTTRISELTASTLTFDEGEFATTCKRA